MRKHIKNQLQEIISSLYELHSEILNKNTEDIIASLQDCQQAAIVVGETLEQKAASVKKGTEGLLGQEEAYSNDVGRAVSLLEKYCEELFFISQEDVVSVERVERLNVYLDQVSERIDNLKTTYQIVFFPYKAEMWDSLESIWRATKEDGECEAVVVPIPYYRYDAKKKETMVCYDGDKFPEDVPVVSYLEFSLQQEMPDVAYIHNPYDDSNLVTSVHPGFYASELKKYVEKLVYVPYYVTTGGISQDHLLFPAYYHMDYMVVQSQYFKDGCRDMFYYDRVLPFGSPKLDKVIQLCQQGKEKVMPACWRSCLEGKKSLMLNTSLNCFLQQGEMYMQKMRILFQWVKENKKIAIVWRPHPLLEATIDSLRPQLLEQYQELKDYFIKEDIGIFDDTPDVSKTVAIVDGYIGEESTSIVNLFGAAGKPLFILNNFIYGDCAREWKYKIRIADMIYAEGKWYLTAEFCNGIFSIDGIGKNVDEIDWKQMQYVGCMGKQRKWYSSHPYLTNHNGYIYMSPGAAFNVGKYHMDTKEISALKIPKVFLQDRKFMQCREMVSYGEKLFFLPNKNGAVWRYCAAKQEWSEYRECIEEIRKDISPEKYGRFLDISGYIQEGRFLYMTFFYTNRVLCFDLESSDYKVYNVGNQGNTYSAITGGNGIFWLAETASGKVIKWDVKSNQIQEFTMPKEFECWTRFDGAYVAHNKLFETKQYVITVPAFSNGMVKVDKATGKVSFYAKELWENVRKACNDYHPQFHPASGFAAKTDENTLWVQRIWDDALIELNVCTEEVKVSYPEISNQVLENLLGNADGFERPSPSYSAFARRESRWFPMKDFMEELVSGKLEKVRERQLQELSEFAVNLDGSCGEKVHEFIIEDLKGNKVKYNLERQYK